MSRFVFDPDHVANLETEGWRSYYDRNWPRVLYLMERTAAVEFHIPFPLSIRAAYLVTRAAIAFKPIESDLPATRSFLERYYRMVRRYSGLTFDPVEVARLELEYWVVHRRLAGAADHGELVDVLTELHATTFGIPGERARDSGDWRTKAAVTVDRITSRRTTDVEADWRVLEEQLRSCYHSLREATAP
jgi:hypothetical protein